jgi:hypothetical protein
MISLCTLFKLFWRLAEKIILNIGLLKIWEKNNNPEISFKGNLEVEIF